MEVTSKIDFVSTNFKFIVQYFEGILHLECTHTSDFFVWKACISESIKSSENNDCIKWELKPKTLHNLFDEYAKNNLASTYQFIFPETYKTSETDLIIELVMKLQHTDDTETKVITLKPFKISDAERFSCILKNEKILSEKNMMKNLNVY